MGLKKLRGFQSMILFSLKLFELSQLYVRLKSFPFKLVGKADVRKHQ
ncbi:MAG: hypothetical protein ACJA01_000646 [Saprospiraceae bacterium]|jgi:hypothetical protein